MNNDGESYSVIGIGTCTDTDVVIPATYNGLPVTDIGASAFRDIHSMTSIVIPVDVTCIGNYAFHTCISLTSINISNGVTSIGSMAFSGCSSLTSIVIPDSETNIGWHTFAYCSGLTDITFNGTMEQWNAIDKASGWDLNTGSYVIHCTDGDISK